MSRLDIALLACFDVLFNAVGSFLVAAALVALAIRAFRIGPGRAAQALWAIPFVKVLYDGARGIPADSFFWAKLSGAVRELGAFSAGFGFELVVPTLHLTLASITDRGRFPSTAADLAATGLSRHVGPWAPHVVAALVLAVGLGRLGLRAARAARGERARRRLEAAGNRVDVRTVGRRSVDVFVSAAHRGAPFTGGLARPYVCFPAATYEGLSAEEREAALQHELAHVAQRDLWLVTGVGILGDLLWFVPGAAAVRRRIEASCEHLADAAAVRAGVSAVALAAALVRVGELLASRAEAPALALRRPRTAIARRVAALIGPPEPGPRWGFQRPWLRALLCVWITAAGLLSTFGGHH